MAHIFRAAERVYVNMDQLDDLSHVPCPLSVYWHKNSSWDHLGGGEYYFHSAYSLPVVASLMVQYPAGCDVTFEWGVTSASDVFTMRAALAGVPDVGAIFVGQIANVGQVCQGAAYPLWFQNDLPIAMPPLPRPVVYMRSGGSGCRMTHLSLKRRAGVFDFYVNGVFSGSLPLSQDMPERIRFGLVVSIWPGEVGPVCYATFPMPVEGF